MTFDRETKAAASPWSEADMNRSHGIGGKWQARLCIAVDQMNDRREQESNGDS